jgi:hypothetical protein
MLRSTCFAMALVRLVPTTPTQCYQEGSPLSERHHTMHVFTGIHDEQQLQQSIDAARSVTPVTPALLANPFLIGDPQGHL